jgi:3',5'-cyclic-AMP phosphodiesterase
MIIAQISDMHVSPSAQPVEGRVDTQAHLERAVSHLRALNPVPDVLLVTGDLVNLGNTQEYRLLRELLAPLPMPCYLIPGNHDDRANLRAEFSDRAHLPGAGEFLQYAIDDLPLRLIGLDTVIPGEGGGTLCDQRLAWLDARLSEAPEKPTLIFMHHPPFRTGIAHMDEIGLHNAGAFRHIVARNPQIERIVCGHVHRAIQTRFAGTVAAICPSTAHQIALDLDPTGRAAFTMEPPGLLLHVWDGAGLSTHVVPIGDYPGPFYYRD